MNILEKFNIIARLDEIEKRLKDLENAVFLPDEPEVTIENTSDDTTAA